MVPQSIFITFMAEARKCYEAGKVPLANEHSLQVLREYMSTLKPVPKAVQVLCDFLDGTGTGRDVSEPEEFVCLATATFKLFKHIFHTNNLDSKDILIAVGGTGTGKSTMLGHFQDYPVKTVVIEKETKYGSVKTTDYRIDSPLVGHSFVNSATFQPHVLPPVKIEPFGSVTLVDFPGFSDTRNNAFNYGFLAAYKYFNANAKSCRVVCCVNSNITNGRELNKEIKKALAMVLSNPTQPPHSRLFVSLNYPHNEKTELADKTAVFPSLDESHISFGRLALNNLDFIPVRKALAAWLGTAGTCTPKEMMTGDPAIGGHAALIQPEEEQLMKVMVEKLVSSEEVNGFMKTLFPDTVKDKIGKDNFVFEKQDVDIAELRSCLGRMQRVYEGQSAYLKQTVANIKKQSQADMGKADKLQKLILHDPKFFPRLSPLMQMGIPEVLLAGCDTERNIIWNGIAEQVTKFEIEHLNEMSKFANEKAMTQMCSFLSLDKDLDNLKKNITQAQTRAQDRQEVINQYKDVELLKEKGAGVGLGEVAAVAGGVAIAAIVIPTVVVAGAVTGACIGIGSLGLMLWNRIYQQEQEKDKAALSVDMKSFILSLDDSMGELASVSNIITNRKDALAAFEKSLMVVKDSPYTHCRNLKLVQLD